MTGKRGVSDEELRELVAAIGEGVADEGKRERLLRLVRVMGGLLLERERAEAFVEAVTGEGKVVELGNGEIVVKTKARTGEKVISRDRYVDDMDSTCDGSFVGVLGVMWVIRGA